MMLLMLMLMFDLDFVVVVWSRRYGTLNAVRFTVGVWRRFGFGRFWYNDLDSKSWNCTKKCSCLLYDIYMFLTKMSESSKKTVVPDIGGLEWDHVRPPLCDHICPIESIEVHGVFFKCICRLCVCGNTLVIHISGAQWPSCISLAERMAFFGILINMVLGPARWQSNVSLHGWYQHGTSFWSSIHKVWRQGITREDKKRMNCSNDYSRLHKFVKKWEVFVCLGQTSISQISKHV